MGGDPCRSNDRATSRLYLVCFHHQTNHFLDMCMSMNGSTAPCARRELMDVPGHGVIPLHASLFLRMLETSPFRHFGWGWGVSRKECRSGHSHYSSSPASYGRKRGCVWASWVCLLLGHGPPAACLCSHGAFSHTCWIHPSSKEWIEEFLRQVDTSTHVVDCVWQFQPQLSGLHQTRRKTCWIYLSQFRFVCFVFAFQDGCTWIGRNGFQKPFGPIVRAGGRGSHACFEYPARSPSIVQQPGTNQGKVQSHNTW